MERTSKKKDDVPKEWGSKFCCRCDIEHTEGRPHFNNIECLQAQQRVIKALREEFVKAWLWRQENFSRMEFFKDFARAYGEYKRLLKESTIAAEFNVPPEIARCWNQMDAAMEKLYPGGFPDGW